jgi:signal transduction histidine kinase
LKTLGGQVNNLAEDIHRMSRQLHPAILDDLGLEAALGEECDSFSRHAGIPVEFQAADVPRSLPEDVALCLYRIAQESLRNIGKHAQATNVRMLLTLERNVVTLSIVDVGDGFDLDEVKGKGGLGLISMEERARLVNGVLTIQSQPGVGTRVELQVSLGPRT